MKTVLENRLKERLKVVGLKPAQASKKAGYSPDYIRNIFRGGSESPRTEPLRKIAMILECSVEYLIGEIDILFPDEALVMPTIPLISSVQAGHLAEVSDPYPVGMGDKDIPYENPHKKIALRVEGASMNRISPEGSIIVVDLSDRELIPNRLYVVKIGDEATYKRFRKNPDRLEPVSFDPKHQDNIYLGDKPVFPVGRVVRTMMDFE